MSDNIEYQEWTEDDYTNPEHGVVYNTSKMDEFDSVEDLSNHSPFPDDEIGVTAEDPVQTIQRQVQ